MFSRFIPSYVIYVKQYKCFVKPAVVHDVGAEVVFIIGIVVPKHEWVVQGVISLYNLASSL